MTQGKSLENLCSVGSPSLFISFYKYIMAQGSFNSKTSSFTSNKSFKSLPPEIIREIFCYVDSEHLFRLQSVCSYWNYTIKQLLCIEKQKLPSDRIYNATVMFELFGPKDLFSFSVHQSPCIINNLINQNVIKKQTGKIHDKIVIEDIYFGIVFRRLKGIAKYFHLSDCETYKIAWRCVLSLTGVEHSVDQLVEEDDSDFVENYMYKYKWYDYSNSSKAEQGIIALYPDNKTFAILTFSAWL